MWWKFQTLGLISAQFQFRTGETSHGFPERLAKHISCSILVFIKYCMMIIISLASCTFFRRILLGLCAHISICVCVCLHVCFLEYPCRLLFCLRPTSRLTNWGAPFVDIMPSEARIQPVCVSVCLFVCTFEHAKSQEVILLVFFPFPT